MTRSGRDSLASDFHEKHRQIYGHANPAEPVQLVNLRLTAIGQLPRLTLEQRSDTSAKRRRACQVWFRETSFVGSSVHWRDGLMPGEFLPGPAIIESMDATILVPPGWIASVDAKGYIRLSRR